MSEQKDKQDAQMRDHIAAIGGKNAIAIIDFGTRGLRMIVGPKQVPAEIGEHTLRMFGVKPNIGLDIVDLTLPLRARSLQFATHTIRNWRQLAKACGLNDLHLISTAWFRWLDNKAEVRDFVKRRTGLTIQPIDQQREAELTLLSLPVLAERWRGVRPGPAIAENDTVAMVDQGGGSLQVSWMRWGDRGKPEITIERSTFTNLGTVARRRDFFWLDAQKNRIGDGDTPLKNQATIRLQVQRIAEATRETLKDNLELPRAKSCAPGKLHLFGVGSAISDLAGDRNVYERHNFRVDAERIAAALEKRLSQLRETTAPGEEPKDAQVRSIWRGMRLPARDQTDATLPFFKNRKELDESLTALFGLPIYQEVLKHAGVGELTLSGYGLSYGYYFAECLPRPQRVSGKHPDDRGPYMFVSYCHEDKADVEAEIDMLRATRFRLWYDDALDAKTTFTKRIADKIDSSAGLIVFITPRSVKRAWVEREVTFAFEKKKLVIPVLLEPTKLPNTWGLMLAGTDHVQRHGLDPDKYQEKLERKIPPKCRRSA
jgi:exopolyphosphatase/pppGpp-phosphohydrolase